MVRLCTCPYRVEGFKLWPVCFLHDLCSLTFSWPLNSTSLLATLTWFSHALLGYNIRFVVHLHLGKSHTYWSWEKMDS